MQIELCTQLYCKGMLLQKIKATNSPKLTVGEDFPHDQLVIRSTLPMIYSQCVTSLGPALTY